MSGPLFEVTPAIRTQFLGMLRERGVTLEQGVIDATWPFMQKQIGNQTARFAFGRAGQVQRQATDDPVLSNAKRLAARATSPASLLQIANQGAPAARQP